jgi:outer membrane receptor protein involved in Fe transport
MDVAKPPLERSAGKDGVDTGLFVDPIGDIDGAVNGITRGQTDFSPVRNIDGAFRSGACKDIRQNLQRVSVGGTEPDFGFGDTGLYGGAVSEFGEPARRFVPC